MTSKPILLHGLLAAILILLPGLSVAVDWVAAPSQELILFFPGTATWERLLSKESHPGASAIRKRSSCLACHKSTQVQMGLSLATEKNHRFYAENSGLSSVKTTLQIARDDTSIYFRIGLNKSFDGQLSLMLDNGAFASSALNGCWASCHQDSVGMPDANGMELTKYLSRSRTKRTPAGGGKNYKSTTALEQLIANGEFLELLEAQFSDTTTEGRRGYVLDRRYSAKSSSATVQLTRGENITYVVIGRPLASHSATEKPFVEDQPYSVAVALHLAGESGARHRVSLPANFILTRGNNIQFIEVRQ